MFFNLAVFTSLEGQKLTIFWSEFVAVNSSFGHIRRYTVSLSPMSDNGIITDLYLVLHFDSAKTFSLILQTALNLI
jgi:hypothetical protein